MKKEAYLVQISSYLKNNDDNAYSLAVNFVTEYPKEMISHYILAKIAFEKRKYGEAAKESRLAYNLSENNYDLEQCAIIGALSYHFNGETAKGIELLSESIKVTNNQNSKKLLFILNASQNEKKEIDLNEKEIIELITIIKSS